MDLRQFFLIDQNLDLGIRPQQVEHSGMPVELLGSHQVSLFNDDIVE